MDDSSFACSIDRLDGVAVGSLNTNVGRKVVDPGDENLPDPTKQGPSEQERLTTQHEAGVDAMRNELDKLKMLISGDSNSETECIGEFPDPDDFENHDEWLAAFENWKKL